MIIIFSILLSSNSFGQDTLQINADSLVAIAKSQLGVTYKWGTSSPNVSFDCSGFTSFVYSYFDIPNSRSSKAYGNLGEAVSLADCKKGDCIIFSGTQPGSKTIGHVGIVIENNKDGLKFIHCSLWSYNYRLLSFELYQANFAGSKAFLIQISSA